MPGMPVYSRVPLRCAVLASLLLAAAATASTPTTASGDADRDVHVARMRAQVVGTMVLTGTLAIAADGGVTGYTIDRADKVPPQVMQHVARYVPHWRVKDAGGIESRKRFGVRVMATPQGDGNFALALVGASIMEPRDPERDIAREGRFMRPEYPRAHAGDGVSGTVYMILRVERDGRVHDLAAEQVDLDFVGAPMEVAQVRADFAAHTAAAARQWRFRLPAAGPLSTEPYLVVRVPVHYSMKARPAYGAWEYYVPGPRRSVPWATQDSLALGAGDAGALELLGVGPRLETPLQPQRRISSSGGVYTIP